ncbi:MAG: hypothetical protein AAGD14_09150 [Planctomycetota bacterium]
MAAFRQLFVEWLPGDMRALCVLRREPPELTRDLGIVFDDSYDNLDMLRYAVIEAPSGRIFGLVRHRGAPGPGTQVLVELGYRRPECGLDEVLVVLGESRDELLWTHPDEAPTDSE